jgi:hypothetical protein
VEAWVTAVPGPEDRELVQAKLVVDDGRVFYYAIDAAKGGALSVDVSGGAGGHGGPGGSGGAGGNGNSLKDVPPGDGADGGPGACGGDGGSGGDVMVHVDPAAWRYLDSVSFHTTGGAGGEGGDGGSGGAAGVFGPGSGARHGRSGAAGCSGNQGSSGHLQTQREPVDPLW